MPRYSREYSDGYEDGYDDCVREQVTTQRRRSRTQYERPTKRRRPQKPKKKRTTLSAWQKFVKTNSKKKEFRLRGGKVNLKKLGVAYRKKTGKRKGKK